MQSSSDSVKLHKKRIRNAIFHITDVSGDDAGPIFSDQVVQEE